MCNLLSHLFSSSPSILDAKELSITTIKVFLVVFAPSLRNNAAGLVELWSISLRNYPIVKVVSITLIVI